MFYIISMSIIFIIFLIFYFLKNGKVRIYQNSNIPISMITPKIKNDDITYISRTDCFSFCSPHMITHASSNSGNFNMDKTMEQEASIFSRQNSLDENKSNQANRYNQVISVPIKLIRVSKVIPQDNIKEIPIDFRASGTMRKKRLFVFLSSKGEYHKTIRCFNLEDPEPVWLSDAVNLKMKPCPICFQ